MLPFLQPKKSSGIIQAVKKSDGSLKDEGMEGEPNHGLLAAAEDILSAIAAKDATALASALQAAYDMCESAVPENDAISE